MRRFADTAAAIAAAPTRAERTAVLAAYLRRLSDDDLPRAVTYMVGMPFPLGSGKALKVGPALVRDSALDLGLYDREVFDACLSASGDLGETVAAWMPRREPSRVTLAEVADCFDRLARLRATADRVTALRELLSRVSGPEALFLVRIITGGMRIGLQETGIEDAVAAATGRDPAGVARAHALCSDLGAVALAARQGRLSRIAPVLMRPVRFASAPQIDDAGAVEDLSSYVVEDRYDGMRVQVHRNGEAVEIFSKGIESVTHYFPELLAPLRSLSAPSFMLDAVVCALEAGRPGRMDLLRTRFSRKAADLLHSQEAPVCLVVFDVLLLAGRPLLDRPFDERRAALAALALPPGIMLPAMHSVTTADDVKALLASCPERSAMGMVLKSRGAPYEAGRATRAWLKLRSGCHVVRAVVTAFEMGAGARAGVLAECSLAVRSAVGLAGIGRTGQGLSLEEARDLTSRLRALAVRRHGGTVIVRPELVLEVAFDGLSQSRRHRSGHVLRYPRILRAMPDGTEPDSAETLLP